MRRLLNPFLVAFLFLILLFYSGTRLSLAGPSGIITVTTSDPAISSDGECSLIEAIVNANDDAPTYADCPAGNGADIIELEPETVYTLTEIYSGTNGLPTIFSDITIDGQGATIARDTAPDVPNFRLFEVAASGALSLDSVILSGGRVTETTTVSTGAGGAILNAGSVTLTQSTVKGNEATWGGGILNLGAASRLSVTESTFQGNRSDQNGGAIFNAGGTTIVNASTIEDNRSLTTFGGGIFNNDGTVVITDSTIQNNAAWLGGGGLANSAVQGNGSLIITASQVLSNTSYGAGGGIANASGEEGTAVITVTRSIVQGNTVLSPDPFSGLGGGIVNIFYDTSTSSASIVTINQSTVSGNRAANGGGIANVSNLPVGERTLRFTVNSSTVSDNVAEGAVPQSGNGGGLFNTDGELIVVNSTVSGNAATGTGEMMSGLGGGIASTALNSPATVTIVNSTIGANSAATAGGGLTNAPIGATATMTVKNTIVAGNGFVNCYNAGILTSQGHNLEDGNSCLFTQETDKVNTDPLLGPLADNGGPTETHALMEGSPAIDAGDDDACAAEPVNGLDQRGVSRPQGSACDIGAYEVEVAGYILYFPIIIR